MSSTVEKSKITKPAATPTSGRLFFLDVGGGRVFSSNPDGSDLKVIVNEGRRFPDGIVVDVAAGYIYWTNMGNPKSNDGSIERSSLGATLRIPKGKSPADRKDVALLLRNLREPVDLDLALANRMRYWRDRGDPPHGNTVNRAPMDATPGTRKDPEILFTHLMEGIGLALDLKSGRMFITDLGGSVYSANLDGSNKKTLLVAEGNLTGIAYAELPVTL